jgi:hypothetical protein
VKKAVTLFLTLALECTTLLWAFGDFTPYAGGITDRDVWVTQPSPIYRFMEAAGVGVAFAAICTTLFVGVGQLVPAYRLLCLFVVTALGFTGFVYFYGDFKTLLGGGSTSLVHYELPWGVGRLLISAIAGLVLGLITAAGAWLYREARSSVP